MVDSLRSALPMLRLEHRHGDRWVRLEPSPAHDAAESDPERAWEFGRIFRCPECSEEIRIDRDGDDRTPD